LRDYGYGISASRGVTVYVPTYAGTQCAYQRRNDHAELTLIGCLHDRANIEQLARRSMVISMLFKRAGGL